MDVSTSNFLCVLKQNNHDVMLTLLSATISSAMFNSVATASNLEASDPPNKAQSSFRTNFPASDWWSVHDL